MYFQVYQRCRNFIKVIKIKREVVSLCVNLLRKEIKATSSVEEALKNLIE